MQKAYKLGLCCLGRLHLGIPAAQQMIGGAKPKSRTPSYQNGNGISSTPSFLLLTRLDIIVHGKAVKHSEPIQSENTKRSSPFRTMRSIQMASSPADSAPIVELRKADFRRYSK